MLSIKRWRQGIKEKDKLRQDTLGRLLHTCIFLPFIMTFVVFISKNYGWTWFSTLFTIIVLIFLGYKTEDLIFRLLGKYSYKIIKAPYSYIISVTIALTCCILLFGKY